MHGTRSVCTPRSPTVLLFFATIALAAVPALATQTPSAPKTRDNSPVAESAPVAKADYVVIKPAANMYRDASVQSDVVSQAIDATNVQRVKTKHGWADVRTADNYTGWIQASNLRKLSGQAYAAAGSIVRVSQLSSNIYRETDVTKHAPIVTIPWESRLEVASEKVADGDRWIEVCLPDGSTGFVQRGDVSSDFTPLSIEQTIALAKKFLGVTYTWEERRILATIARVSRKY
jgi:gamma-D-glutamyl-L-lysine dipeptidyl-peptidase